jgi:RES domain-containing protein
VTPGAASASRWAERALTLTAAYRACREVHAGGPDAALSGDGGLHRAGRWNALGQRIVYAASSPALSALERLVHLELPFDRDAAGMVGFWIRIPQEVSRAVLAPGDLEAAMARVGRGDWRADPDACRAVAQAAVWGPRTACVLLAPSAVVPEDVNVVIDPTHPDMALVRAATDPVFEARPLARWDDRIADVLDLAARRGAAGA